MSKKHSISAGGADTAAPAIKLTAIDKSFGTVHANQNVDLHVASGTVHGVIGENGAGKSTLVSILYGFYSADSGQIDIFGQPADIRSTADAIAAGIGMVHQHFMLVPNFTVLENIIIGHEGSGSLLDGIKAAEDKLRTIADHYGLQVDLHARVGDLPVGLQQRVEILKALYRGARILILDEPTGVLTPQEAEQLFSILDSLRVQGVTVLLITHKLREIMAVTDTVSVMRAGQMVAHLKTADTNPADLAQLMIGRPVLLSVGYTKAQTGDVVLSADRLCLHGNTAEYALRDISFDLYRREIFGIAGVSGNGQSELLDILAGIRELSAGRLKIGMTEITPQAPLSPSQIKALGVAHIPEDRHAAGLVLPFSAGESAILGYEKDIAAACRGWFLQPRTIRAHCAGLMQAFDVRPADPDLRTSLFSGGNQQKLVVAREMSSAPDILLVGQPTRGVDIGAIEFIHNQLLRLRDAGSAIILVSVELDEILNLSDRIMVVNAGRNMGIIDRSAADAQKIGLMMAGVPVDELPAACGDRP